MYSPSIFSKTNNRSSDSTKEHTKFKIIEKISSIKDLDHELQQEKERLLKRGAKKLSGEYLALLEQRKRLDSSPRFVGGFPHSPTKNVSETMSEHHRRSPTDMIRGFLEQAPKKTQRNCVGTLLRKAQPMEISAVAYQSVEPSIKPNVEPTQVAFGLSVLRPSYIQEHFDSLGVADASSTNENLSSSVVSSLTDSHVSSYSDGEPSLFSVFGSFK
tara:strand:- start:20590 stop:21234 length:645 start_codon:yes stop_codon:yes gene_type:complete